MESPLNILLYPFVSEKAVGMIEKENKITFIVDDKATKEKIKEAMQEFYKVKVESINVIRDNKGRKRAIVRLKKEFRASELASKLGVM